MTDIIVYVLGITMVLVITLAIRAAGRRLAQAGDNQTVRDKRMAALIAHHWVEANYLPDRYTEPVIRCGGCDFTGPTRLHHARHVVAAIRRLDDADHRIAAQLHAMYGRAP